MKSDVILLLKWSIIYRCGNLGEINFHGPGGWFVEVHILDPVIRTSSPTTSHIEEKIQVIY